MGLDNKGPVPVQEECLLLARKIVLFNCLVIYYVKNSLKLMTEDLAKELAIKHEKFDMMIKSSYPNVDTEQLLATTKNNDNHDLTKIDEDLIAQMLLESITTKKDNNGGAVL